MKTSTLVKAYHTLIDLEHEKYKKTKNLSEAKFTQEEAIEYLGKNFPDPRNIFEELLKRGFIIDLGGVFRTLHFDVAYRVANIRIQYETARYPLETKIIMDEEPLPAWEDHAFEELENLINDETIYSILSYSLYKDGYEGQGGGEIKGFSDFQWKAIKNILDNDKKDAKKAYVLSAPTSGGKTYAFLVPILTEIIKGKLNGETRRVLLIYPRKSLERDQLNKIISIIYMVNAFFRDFLNKDVEITIGIDDGETLSIARINSGEEYRGVTCPRKGCGKSPLEYSKSNRGIKIRCKSCGYNFDWILPSREQVWSTRPDILITNVWTLDWRLPSKTIQHDYELYKEIKYIVMDEAHAYQSILGGNIRYLMKRLINSIGEQPKIILSSATLPHPKKFAIELLDLEEKDIVIVSSEEESNRKKKVIYLVMGIHPRKSWETAAYELALLYGTVSYFKGIQSVIFIDSIKSINRIYFGHLKVAVEKYNEPIDHLRKSVVNDANDPYAFWVYSNSHLEENLPKKIFDKIYIHHANVERREKIEKEFAQGKYGVLLATSTLELGVDYPNVGIIMNVGIPFRFESLPQRVGRAGRNPEKTLNTILAIILLRNTPLEMYYIFYPKRLLKGFKNVTIPISWENIAVKRYHAVSAILDRMGKEGLPTYILQSDGQPEKLETFIMEVLNKLNDDDLLREIEEMILKEEDAEKILKEIFRDIAMLSKNFEEIKKYKSVGSGVGEIFWELEEFLKKWEGLAKEMNIENILDKVSEIKKICKEYGVILDGF